MLRKKLKSQSGVSILLALFLFLICAAIGSIVLTAATTTSGRKELTAQNDQRYYSVDSAAGLIRDLVTDGSIRVQRIKSQDTDYIEYIERTDNGSSHYADTYENKGEPTYSLVFPGMSESEVESDILAFAAKNMIPGADGEINSAVYAAEIEGSGSSMEFSFSTGEETPFLDVSVKMTVESSGDLVFDITSDKYSLRETFCCVFSENRSVRSSSTVPAVAPVSDTRSTESYTVTDREIKEGTFRWEFVSCSVK